MDAESQGRPLGIPSGAGSQERPECFLHDLQLSPSPASPPLNLRWSKITMPSRSACWKWTRLEGNKGWPNEEMHQWISPNHVDLKTCQTGLKLANTQENLLNATVMIHLDSLQFWTKKRRWNNCIYHPPPNRSHNLPTASEMGWRHESKDSVMRSHCQKSSAETSWRLRLAGSSWFGEQFLERTLLYVCIWCTFSYWSSFVLQHTDYSVCL